MPRFLSVNKLALLGAGAAAGGALGMYIYKSPKLRRQMRKAESVREAATLLKEQIKQDSAEVANTAVASMAGNIAGSLTDVKRTLGSRFLHKRGVARQEARHLRSEARHSARVTKRAARHAAKTAKHEVKHLRDEANASAHRATAA